MFKLSRILIAYAIAVPLALFLGYLVSTPDTFTFMVVGMVMFFFALPLFLKWHHAMLIIFWNSVFNFAFLPGAPDVWLLFAVLSFGISFLNHIIFQKKFLRAPDFTRPLLFMAAVVLGTAWYRGGLGVRAFGGASYGGKYYIYVLGAIMGYFALTAEQIPLLKGRKMGDLFFFSGTSFALSNLVYALGPAFFFLYYLVPTSLAMGQATSGMTNMDRISGLAPACNAGLCFLLARYGIRGLFDLTKPWRLMLLCATIGASFFSGFRSAVILLLLIFALQFYFEGLLRTHLLPIVIGFAICGFAPILFFSDSMPPVVQRAISYLPVNVDSDILAEATGSKEWRFNMWAVVMTEIPKYLLIGKGYSVDPAEIFAANEASRLGTATNDYEGSMVAGDYHSGPLSVIIPFGIGGVVSFIWVLIAGFRVLLSNHRFGDARLRRINSVLLAYYVANCISFIFIFGAFNSQLPVFLGAIGLSVSLNGGVKRRASTRRDRVPVSQTLAMQPG